tara:strand:- start:531 stop:776 length:246 start_codon:yes stop_codon:yes gene_type:complete
MITNELATQYAIAPMDDIDLIDPIEVLGYKDTWRRNLEESKLLIGFEGPTPDTLSLYTIYSHTDMLSLVRDLEGGWYEDNE